jgi:hypothetical protein
VSLVTRFHGFTLSPPFVENGSSKPVSIAIDGSRFTVWMGEPATVWQTPISELHHLHATVGRSLTIRFTIAGTRYRLHSRRFSEHGELLDLIRASGGTVARATRARAVLVLSVVAVFVAASLASVVTFLSTSSAPSAAELSAVNVSASDLPPTFVATPNSYISVLTGPAGAVTTNSTPAPRATVLASDIFHTVSTNFYSCMHVPGRNDRFFGSAGVVPQIQVSGASYRSPSFGGMEIASYAQYYASTQMVSDDLKEYSSARFGPCFAQESVQELLGVVHSSADAARAAVATMTYTPFTFAHGWRRGGTATVLLPGFKTPFTLISILVAQGHREVGIFALVANFTSNASHSVVTTALNAVLARLDPATTSGAA